MVILTLYAVNCTLVGEIAPVQGKGKSDSFPVVTTILSLGLFA